MTPTIQIRKKQLVEQHLNIGKKELAAPPYHRIDIIISWGVDYTKILMFRLRRFLSKNENRFQNDDTSEFARNIDVYIALNPSHNCIIKINNFKCWIRLYGKSDVSIQTQCFLLSSKKIDPGIIKLPNSLSKKVFTSHSTHPIIFEGSFL